MVGSDRHHWERLLAQAQRAARQAPSLALFREAVAGDREALLADLGYTFWNRELADSLAARLLPEAGLGWVELAAGTGRWTLEMVRRGLPVAATDSFTQEPGRVRSFQRTIHYGGWVDRLTADEAVERFHPGGVLCAWPPLGQDLVGRLLQGTVPGSQSVRLLVCIGEPGGASELPSHHDELPPGWCTERWTECEPYLIGFNDPPPGPGWQSHSRLLVYRRGSG